MNLNVPNPATPSGITSPCPEKAGKFGPGATHLSLAPVSVFVPAQAAAPRAGAEQEVVFLDPRQSQTWRA